MTVVEGRYPAIVLLIIEEDKMAGVTILLLSFAGGVARSFAMMLIMAMATSPKTTTFGSVALLVLTIGVATLMARQRFRRLNTTIEKALLRIKMRLIDKIEQIDLHGIEGVERSEILDSMTENFRTVSTNASPLGEVFQAVFIVVSAMLYVFWLSTSVFIMLLGLFVLVFYFYRSRWKFITELLHASSVARARFLGSMIDVLAGAKEIRLSRARRRDILADFDHQSNTLRRLSTDANQVFADDQFFAMVNLFFVFAAVIFILPKYGTMVQNTLLPTVVAAILFLWGGVVWLASFYGTYLQSNEALEQIFALENRLAGAASVRPTSLAANDPWMGRTGRIEAKHIEYEYPSSNGDAPFNIGPIDLTIELGEVVFIVGGNGSGKSTLLKVLTGLYPLHCGTLRLGDFEILPDTAAAYRESIAAIFSDHHLFSVAYGMLDANPETIQTLLAQMQIDHKTSFRNGEFSTRKLSTGQKKRIAMAIALFDDRPIFVLDEWAADQDPEFRRYFYENLIPALKNKGKTVIAVSHDDRYFHFADRVVMLDYGTIRSIQTNRPAHQEIHAGTAST